MICEKCGDPWAEHGVSGRDRGKVGRYEITKHDCIGVWLGTAPVEAKEKLFDLTGFEAGMRLWLEYEQATPHRRGRDRRHDQRVDRERRRAG